MFWQKFDQQKQFHVTKQKHFEQVSNDMVIRMAVHGATIEIKKDLTRFEDSYHDFINIDFEGWPDVTVGSFTPYTIPGRPHLMFITVDPLESDLYQKAAKQFCLLLDSEELVAHECSVDDDDVFTKIYFTDQNRFLGQRKTGPIYNQICLYHLVYKEHRYQALKQFQSISINLRRITSFAYDLEKQCLLLV